MSSVFSGDVLVVEDNFIIAMDVEELVRALGAGSVHIAANCDDALAVIDSHSLQAAILDFNVEGGTTESVADKLAEAGVPFVFATGYSDTEMLPERFRAHPMLKKPFSSEDIETTFTALPGHGLD